MYYYYLNHKERIWKRNQRGRKRGNQRWNTWARRRWTGRGRWEGKGRASTRGVII